MYTVASPDPDPNPTSGSSGGVHSRVKLVGAEPPPIVCSMGFGRVSSHKDRVITSSELFQYMSATQRKVRSHEDDNYSNWAIISYGACKGLYHISCLLQIIKPFIRPPQGLLIYDVIKMRQLKK